MHLLQLVGSVNHRSVYRVRVPIKRFARQAPPCLEALEPRTLLSFTPTQIRHAYGFDRVGFEDATHSNGCRRRQRYNHRDRGCVR